MSVNRIEILLIFYGKLQDTLRPDIHQYAHKGTGFIGYYKNSLASGKFWAGMLGGYPYGHLHGIANPLNGTITGSNISYIYPDMETALLGKFHNRMMRDAQESTVLGVTCDEKGLLYVSQYSNPEPSSPHYYYEPPSNISYGAGPPGVLDPYERKWLELRPAHNPKMGEGVYTKRDLKKHMLASSYNGLVFGHSNGEHEIYSKNCMMNLTKTNDERRHCKKYSLGLSPRDATINIPPEFDQPDSFLPSWGPKVSQLLYPT